MGNLVVDLASDVERFATEVIGLPIPREPERLSPARKDWALTAMGEELTEFKDATNIDDEADALIDLTYFALGRLVEMGIAPRPVFEEVHRANMRKRRGELSKRPNSLGYDAVKPDGWTPPELAPLLSVTLTDVEDMFERRLAARSIPVLQGYAAMETFGELPQIFPGTLEEFSPEVHEPERPKIVVLGYGRHGKDTVCELLSRKYGLSFTSSSEFCAERVILPKVQAEWAAFERTADGGTPAFAPPIGPYATAEECFGDRHRSQTNRAYWYDTICEYNQEDPTRLGREILEVHDVYCGIRSKREFHGLTNVGAYDLAIWVDASDRVPPEDTSSCTVEPWMADMILDNNGTLEQLERGLDDILKHAFGGCLRKLDAHRLEY